jgi:hypothetical protein
VSVSSTQFHSAFSDLPTDFVLNHLRNPVSKKINTSSTILLNKLVLPQTLNITADFCGTDFQCRVYNNPPWGTKRIKSRPSHPISVRSSDIIFPSTHGLPRSILPSGPVHHLSEHFVLKQPRQRICHAGIRTVHKNVSFQVFNMGVVQVMYVF